MKPPFSDQVSTEIFSLNIFFVLATVAAVLAILGLTLIDSGFVSRRHRRDLRVKRALVVACGGLGMTVIGYPIWMTQFNQAFGLDH